MSRPPNILFILPDQLRADFLGCYGADFVATPHIDRIAAEGVRYCGAFSSSPLCVPARTALLTGMSPLRNGVIDNAHALRPDYPKLGIRTWPELLAEQGYHTAAMGKMHFHPWDAAHGFAERVIAEDKRHTEIRDAYDEFLHSRGLRKLHGGEYPGYVDNYGAVPSPIPWELSSDHFVATAACEFIDGYDGQRPFALMVGLPSPHCPYDPDPRFVAQVDEARLPAAVPGVPGDARLIWQDNINGHRGPWNGVDYTDFPDHAKRRVRLHYAALVRQVDEEVGRILAAHDRRGMAENTVVILSSDHGDYLGDHDMIGKNSFYDAAVRVPLVVRVPGGPTGVTRTELVDLHDITATMLSLAGCEVPDTMDSRPLPGLVEVTQAREHIAGVLGSGWWVFDGRWKLHYYRTGEQLLFDMLTDPDEQRNRISDPAALPELIRLNAILVDTVLEMTGRSYDDRFVGPDLIWDEQFTRPGWQRPYPHPVRPFSFNGRARHSWTDPSTTTKGR